MTEFDILRYYQQTTSAGLFQGKMGASIAAFILDNKIGSKGIAESLLSEVIAAITDNMPLNISHGLSGIGLGINYLLQNKYIEGNPDYVLSEIDDFIFRRMAYFNQDSPIDYNGLCDILNYLIIRLKTGLKNKMNRRVFIELTKKLFNLLYLGRRENFFEEPLPYSIYYVLARFLYISSEMHALQICPTRIEQIWKELKTSVFSRYPYLYSNKLHLIYSVCTVFNESKDKDWSKYLNNLLSTFSFREMIEDELGRNQLFLTDGLLGLHILAHKYNKHHLADIPKIHLFDTSSFIRNSDLFQEYKSKKIAKGDRVGLDGMLGLFLLMHLSNK